MQHHRRCSSFTLTPLAPTPVPLYCTAAVLKTHKPDKCIMHPSFHIPFRGRSHAADSSLIPRPFRISESEQNDPLKRNPCTGHWSHHRTRPCSETSQQVRSAGVMTGSHRRSLFCCRSPGSSWCRCPSRGSCQRRTCTAPASEEGRAPRQG